MNPFKNCHEMKYFNVCIGIFVHLRFTYLVSSWTLFQSHCFVPFHSRIVDEFRLLPTLVKALHQGIPLLNLGIWAILGAWCHLRFEVDVSICLDVHDWERNGLKQFVQGGPCDLGLAYVDFKFEVVFHYEQGLQCLAQTLVKPVRCLNRTMRCCTP